MLFKRSNISLDGSGRNRNCCVCKFRRGFYGIIGDDGNKYYPINLSKEFCIDGLRVYFEGILRDDIVSFHMWGRIIEILYIKKLD